MTAAVSSVCKEGHRQRNQWKLQMVWKEHIAWLAFISITTAAFVFIRYGRDLRNHRKLRAAVLGSTQASFIAAGIAGFFGAMIPERPR